MSGSPFHPVAWAAWLAAVCLVAFTQTNPLALVLALAALAVVHFSLPPSGAPVRRAVRAFVLSGLALLVLRLAFVALLPNPGTTALVSLPRVELPRWAGGLTLGGPVRAEVLVAGAVDGLRLLLVLVAFGIFNAHADLASTLRAVPPALRDLGLVVSIALAFVPGMLRTVRDVRDAQRLRGERGLRRLAPSLAVPVLGLALERALLLAESMEVRAYASARPAPGARRAGGAGLAALAASIASWAGGYALAATILGVTGLVLLVAALRAGGGRPTRLAPPSRSTGDVLLVVAALAAAALSVRAAGYDPYPTLHPPAFDAAGAAGAVLLALPAAVARRPS